MMNESQNSGITEETTYFFNCKKDKERNMLQIQILNISVSLYMYFLNGSDDGVRV
jgi:hypothetical protein